MMDLPTVVVIMSVCLSVSAVPVGRFGPSFTQSVSFNANVTDSSVLSILLNDRGLIDPLENEGITISQGELIEGDIIVPFGWHPREMPMATASGSIDIGGPRISDDSGLRSSARAPGMVRIARPDKTWTDRVIPYVIGDGFNATELSVIQLAMQEVTESSRSCITFVPRDHQDNFIFITGRLSGCNSYVGRQGGNQTVSISSANNCVTKGIVMHELMHVLGFLHEHTRYDRDAYIQIIIDNVIPGQESNFDIHKEADLQNITYDYYSIMHYKTNQFSIHRATLNTIEIRDNTVNLEEVGQRRYLSDKDRTRIQTLYNCPLKGCSYPHTMNDGYIQIKNTSVGSSIRYSCRSPNHVLIGAWERTCLYDGKWSGSTPICYDNNSVISYCNFEDFGICGWTQDLTDEADWTRHSSRTHDQNTGPMEDHTLQNSDGFYMYLEGSGISPNVSARLVSPEFQRMTNGCLMFWYNMYGQGMGTLSVYLKSDGNLMNKIWSISGNQGNSWKMQLVSDINPTVPFQIIFEATRGRLVTTDIAIDDVILGDCQNILPYKDAVIRELKEEYHQCNFDSEFCGWYQWSNASLQWYRQGGSTPSLFTGPSCDCNNCSQCSNGSGTGYSCIHFEYHMYGRDIGNLSVYLSEYNSSTLVWSTSGTKGDRWIPKQLHLFTNESFQVAFTATSGGSYQGDIAVDDVMLHTGVCPVEHACDFDQGSLCEFYNDNSTDDFDWTVGNHLAAQTRTGPPSDHTTGKGGSRRRSERSEDLPHVQAAKEEILPGYEEYLVLLQERNRLLKKLRKKDKSQIEIERKEQGFSVYVNGPHKGAQQQQHPTKSTIPTNPRTVKAPKTAGDAPRNPSILDNKALQEITRNEVERQKEAARAKTAPSARERRRNWNVESVEIKTTRGERKVKAPEILTGKYADDFEDEENSDDVRSSASEKSDKESPARQSKTPVRKAPPPRESDMFNSSDSVNSEEELHQEMSRIWEDDGEDLEIDATKFSKQSPWKQQKYQPKGRQPNVSGDGSDKLMLSMRELKQLRHSLVKNATIRESLARRDSSGEEDFVPEAPIQEVEEDLPTDDSTSLEESPRQHIDLKKPDDTIVIEFGGTPVSSKKVERNLTAARRKDYNNADISSGLNQQRPSSAKQMRHPPKLANRSQSAKTLVSSDKKAVRPLSANRQTPDRFSVDTDHEASAVLAALREENEKAVKYNQDDKGASKVKPSPKAARENLVKPLYDKSEMPPHSHQVRQPETPRDSVPLVSREKIEQIMEKVLRMNPKQQRKLVKMLGSIEQSLVDETKDPDGDKQLTPRRSLNKPVKAVKASISKSSLPVSSTDPNILDVYIEIKSNWGHPMRLGLTEIQLYDVHNNPVPISPSDVTVDGAEEIKGSIDLLFNGKFKTNKERNMWSCRYHARRPVELKILARNPHPGNTDKFELGIMKIWNFNKSINDLEVGIKDIRVFVGCDLVYTGPVEKGCGNQVFDYCHMIVLKSSGEIPSQKSEPEKTQTTQKQMSNVRKFSMDTDSNSKRQPVKEIRKENYGKNIKNGAYIDKNRNSDKVTYSRPPISPRNERSPSPAPKLSSHRSISPSPRQGEKKTFRSISMSSQSSASSGESRPNSGVVTSSDREKQIRSETRTLNYPKVKTDTEITKASSDSLSENEDMPRDGPTQGSTPARRRGSKTPKKSKRMAARLDGHTSSDIDNSRSITDSVPVPQRKSEEKIITPRQSEEKMPPRKSSDKVSRKALVQKSLEKNTKKTETESKESEPTTQGFVVEDRQVEVDRQLDDSMTVPCNTTSSSVSVTSSQDDLPMIQKLKDMNKKEQTTSRKKDVPRWLKQDNLNVPFENPPESRGGQRQGQKTEEPDQPQPTQEEINMLIDEEMSMFPESKKTLESNEEELREESNTPMQRIQKNRSKWRENPSMNLEESWGSLSQFNKNQRGRLSLDMDDDVLDEYINKAAKLAGLPVEPTIPEEGQTEDHIEQPLLMSVESEDDGFIIPELPYGKELVINIRTTWGDKHYVGLTGLEVFSASGEQMNVSKIRADPSDINVLPDYNKDPRVVRNLIDGVNRTRDDIHMWLAPFNKGKDHLVFATLERPCKIALLRIWNYNKSRIHSYRGAKDVVIMLDSTVIFKGEIARACGGIEGGTEAFGDTILFTMDEGILEAVSQNDEAYEGEMLSDDEPFDVERPSTAEGERGDRPFTRAVGNINEIEREATNISLAPEYEGDIVVYKGKCIELNFTATWGDQHYLGLTGLEIVGKDGEALPVSMDTMTASPADVRGLPGHERDDRTLDKLINSTNVTVSDEHMWLIPFTQGNNHTLAISFSQKVLMAGLRIWNYNKSKEDTYRGARLVHVSIDRKVISPPEGYLIRKGPGNCHFDFAQEISFSPDANKNVPVLSALGPSTDESQNYDFVQLPCGFIYQLQLFSTWGDVYYVGLNGLEFYDANLQQIPLTESNISAYPDSVNVLENIQNDARTPDKLIDGVNDTSNGAHTWLAPILPSILNRVYVIFDQPTTISMIKLWNYSKTANRGAKDFALLVDDLLVYNGVLQPVTTGARGILPTVAGPQPHHTILFTNNKDIIKKEKQNIISNQTGEQDVQMTNDKKIVSHYNDPKKAHSGKPVDQNLLFVRSITPKVFEVSISNFTSGEIRLRSAVYRNDNSTYHIKSKRPTTSVIHSKRRR